MKAEPETAHSGTPKSPSHPPGSPKGSTPKTSHRGSNIKTEPMAKKPLIVSQSQSGTAVITRPVKSVNTRSVNISDDVRVYNLSPLQDNNDRPRLANTETAGRPRGRQHCSNVIDVKPKQNDCKVQ